MPSASQSQPTLSVTLRAGSYGRWEIGFFFLLTLTLDQQRRANTELTLEERTGSYAMLVSRNDLNLDEILID